MDEKTQVEKTLKDLQNELISLGMPQESAELMKTKAQAVAIIDTLKASNVVNKVDTLEEKVDPSEDRKIEDSWKSKAQRQIKYWSEQPKVRILVPLEGQEKTGVVKWQYDPKEKRDVQVHVGGAVQPVTENGAKYLVPKGVYVEVPEPVAKVIQDKFQQTSEAGADLLIDRVDPETGRPVRDQL